MELNLDRLIMAAVNSKPSFRKDPDWLLVNNETGETKPHFKCIDAPKTEPFFRVYIDLIGHLFKIRSLAARNLLLWMISSAQPNTNRVHLYKEEQQKVQELLGIKQAQFYTSLKTLETQELIYKVRNGVWEINPDILFNGAEVNRKLLQGSWSARIIVQAIENTEPKEEQQPENIQELQEAYNQA